MKTVAIIGAGASGMAAAVTAAADENNRVVLLERAARVGRKLLATGNGRCNLTNTAAEPGRYHGADPAFARAVLEKYPPEAVIEFFERLGLITAEEYGGRVYPYSNSANSVVDVLRFALERENIELRCGEPVRAVKYAGSGFEIKTERGKMRADALIVACGGLAGAKLGGVSDGYEILKALGHKKTALRPALVQLTADPTYPRALKGVRAEAALRLTGAAEGEARGEVQFTEKGVSGPAAFDLSRAVSAAPDGEKFLQLDFMPDFAESAVFSHLAARKSAAPQLPAAELFTGALHNRLGKMVVKYAALPAEKPLGELSESELSAAARAAKCFVLPLKGTEGFDSAQVTAGGISTADFNPQTLESRIVPMLFACGEVLDIDGDCGGFNLQWAFASGMTAGRLGK